MSGFGKIAVLFGGRSAEREVSLMSGNNVLKALREAGLDAHAFDPAEREIFELKRDGFNRAFIALHGRYGEDGTVQGALELMGIPYTGSGVMASALAMDKVRTKMVWTTAGIPTPRFEVVGADSDWAGVAKRLGLPLIIKPAREGSTIGLTKVTAAAQLPEAYALAARHDPFVMAEEFIAGEELTAGFLGDQALPLIRIEAPQGNYDYQNKYFSDDTQYLVPCGLPAGEEAAIQAIVLKAYRVLGCRGWGRVDVMIDAATRKPWLLEINTSPGMTGHSLVPMSARADGISYEALCLRLLADATLDNPGSLSRP